jgi:L-seryl-tRNA(Ser) seleniumtransferase
MDHSQLKHLPSVGNLLENKQISELESGAWLKSLVQTVVDDLRSDLLVGKINGEINKVALTKRAVETVIKKYKKLTDSSMRKVINASGVVVHTNLGRSVYSERAVNWMNIAATGNVDLEMDLELGLRGHRGRGVEEKATLLAGSEDALVVNNNAAALWLSVRSCAGNGGKVILSRGEIVAIGGSFRLHEILSETGCELIEIGTTNRTSLDDYRKAMTTDAVVLKVHRSNFSQSGFTEEVELAELADLCKETGNILIYDAGSGLLQRVEEFGLPAHSVLREDIDTGADIVTCSGDKLFGGGQAGIIFGKSDLVKSMRNHPLRRAVRVDKTALAVLDGTLTDYLLGNQLEQIPTLQLLDQSEQSMRLVATKLQSELSIPSGWNSEVVNGKASVGGGCFSESELETIMLLFTGPHNELEACHLRMRSSNPALLARISKRGLAIDFRSIPQQDLKFLRELISQAFEVITDG